MFVTKLEIKQINRRLLMIFEHEQFMIDTVQFI